MQRFMEKVSSHATLSASDSLKTFLQSQHPLAPYASKQQQQLNASSSAAQGFAMLLKSAKSPSASKEDEWFDEKKLQLHDVQSSMEKCTRSLEKLSKCRRSLGAIYVDTAGKLMDFGNAEPNVHLAR